MRKTYKKEVFTGRVEYLNHEGLGIVKKGRENIPVNFLLPGETAEITCERNGHNYTTSIINVKDFSKDRVKPECPYFTRCGGCQLMHMSYNAQLKMKNEQIRKLMKGIKVEDIVGMDQPYGYRNKIISSFVHNKKVKSGFYKMYSHDIVAIDRCVVQDKLADPILETIRQLANKYKLKVYNEDRKTGFLRHVLIRTGFKTREVMVVLVVANKVFPSKSQFVQELIGKHPEIKTVVQNINNRKTSVVLGDQETVLYGPGKIKDDLCDLTFFISPKSFYQINPIQTEKLYNLAIEMADIKNTDLVIDTYSGIGTISLIAAKKAKQVFGVEINKDAIKNAVKNAKQNNIKNSRFIEGDAGKVMVQMAKEKVPVDIVFMDPPRAGSDDKFLSSVVKLSPKKVVYISCNPQTQKRDIDYLSRHGYVAKKIIPVDMFPMTAHCETVCLLERVQKKKK